MRCAGPNHEPAPDVALRTSRPPATPAPVVSQQINDPLPSRPTLLPLSFVLTLVAMVSVASAVLTLVAAYFFIGPLPASAQPVASPVVETKPIADLPRPEPVKEKAPAPAADTLAVLPFDILFEPTPNFRHEVEKLNAALPQLLIDEGKLRVKPLAQTAFLKFRRNPTDGAKELNVRCVLTVKFTTDVAQGGSMCHIELIDVVGGFLLWGTQVEAQGDFLKHPELFTQIRQIIVEQVPKRMAGVQE